MASTVASIWALLKLAIPYFLNNRVEVRKVIIYVLYTESPILNHILHEEDMFSTGPHHNRNKFTYYTDGATRNELKFQTTSISVKMFEATLTTIQELLP